MSQVTSESILTTKGIVEQAIKDYHKQILPYLNGEFPTAVAERFAEGNLYTTDEKIIGQWVDGKPLYQCVFPPNSHVPVITTNDARIIKSSQHSEQYAAWHVYDGETTTSWDPGANNGRIGWDFQSAVSVLKFKFGMTRPSNYPVTKIDLCYSDDATNWTTVHSYVMNTDYPNTDEINEFTVQKEVGEHRYWSLYAYCANGWAELHTVDFICIEMPSNIELITTKDLANGNIISQYTKVGDEPVSFGTDTYYSTTEKIIGTWIDGKPIYQIVSNSPEAEIDGALFKPMMTDNNVPSPYVVTSSDLYNGSMQPYKAFDNARYLNGDPDFTDGRDSYYWMTSQIAGSWIKIDLGENNTKEFVNVGLGGIGTPYINCLPRSFTISGSNDDNDYTVLYTSDPDRENGASTDAYLVENFEFERTGQYRYYKLDINTVFNGAANVRVDCIKFYEAAQSIAQNIDKVLSKVHMGDMYVYQYTKTTD